MHNDFINECINIINRRISVGMATDSPRTKYEITKLNIKQFLFSLPHFKDVISPKIAFSLSDSLNNWLCSLPCYYKLYNTIDKDSKEIIIFVFKIHCTHQDMLASMAEYFSKSEEIQHYDAKCISCLILRSIGFYTKSANKYDWDKNKPKNIIFKYFPKNLKLKFIILFLNINSNSQNNIIDQIILLFKIYDFEILKCVLIIGNIFYKYEEQIRFFYNFTIYEFLYCCFKILDIKIYFNSGFDLRNKMGLSLDYIFKNYFGIFYKIFVKQTINKNKIYLGVIMTIANSDLFDKNKHDELEDNNIESIGTSSNNISINTDNSLSNDNRMILCDNKERIELYDNKPRDDKVYLYDVTDEGVKLPFSVTLSPTPKYTDIEEGACVYSPLSRRIGKTIEEKKKYNASRKLNFEEL
ncbi:hypothetical protein TCON_1035 [Astathelohania contejeani]|uniref:Uncharacterized protein n=1 Tax=Astathelohania contejeani TaxID=164912 RepID=A0ABQ7HZX1_9MICR|nr:hypothetical protein TCON_1035 [Thelohania contejeani]